MPAVGAETPAASERPPAHAGTSAIVGLPNVGKSTLLNRILDRRIAAVSPKPQTTRNRILGVHRTKIADLEPPDVELCFVDTPGIQHGKGALRRFMRDEALGAASDCDVALLVIDASDTRGRNPGRLTDPDAEGLTATVAAVPFVIALNKVDKIAKLDLLPLIEAWAAWAGAQGQPDADVVPIAGLHGDGVEHLIATIARKLPVGPMMFPPDMVTDRAEEFLAGELIREQLYLQLGQELPYATAVVIERFEERDAGDLGIDAYIAVERDSQKAIVIGKGGTRIKELGIAARKAMAELFRCPVHLSLFVKIVPDWSTQEAGLRKVGYVGQVGGSAGGVGGTGARKPSKSGGKRRGGGGAQ